MADQIRISEVTVQDILTFIDTVAPFNTQADFDNSGLLTGSIHWTAHGVLFALDATDAVIQEAIASDCNILITHHPLMFSARKNMCETDYEGHLLCDMIRHRIALIAVHTNLDCAAGGTNDVIAKLLGLDHIIGDGYYRVGDLPDGTTVASLTELIRDKLHCTVRKMGAYSSDRKLHRLGISTGAGSESWQDAARLDADCFMTGELKHHHALAMNDAGILGLECGHFATEEPGIFALADALQMHFHALECHLRVKKTRTGPYPVLASEMDGMACK